MISIYKITGISHAITCAWLMSASWWHTFLITTLQETTTFYFRKLGEIARIILIYTQTMSFQYIYHHCTTMSVDSQSRRNPLYISLTSTLRTKCLHSSSNHYSKLIFKQNSHLHPKVCSTPLPLLYSIVSCLHGISAQLCSWLWHHVPLPSFWVPVTWMSSPLEATMLPPYPHDSSLQAYAHNSIQRAQSPLSYWCLN